MNRRTLMLGAPTRLAARPANVVVVCESAQDGASLAYGPFSAPSESAAVGAAKTWLRGQPCRPAEDDPFWQSGLHCERDDKGNDVGCWHSIVVLLES
jgi:hypothetical protein